MSITREQAEQALAQVREQFKYALEPSSEPKLVENWEPFIYRDGKVIETEPVPFAITWENGPDYWAHRAQEGGRDCELTLELRAVTGSEDAVIDTPEARDWPAGVRSEPYFSYVLGLYED